MPMRDYSTACLILSGVLATVIVAGGCTRDDQQAIRVQQVPKQTLPDASQPEMPAMTAPMVASAQGLPGAPASAASEIQWTAPPGWTQLPGSGMRIASFQVSAQRPDVQLTVIPLAPEGGQVLPNINRWEQQIGLPPTKEADLSKIVTRVDAAGVPADTVDLIGPATANPRLELLGAIVNHGERVWFFKLAGPADVVGGQKQNFDAFVKSIRFGGGGAAQPQAAEPAAGGAAQLPAGHPAVPGAEQQPQLPAGHPAIPGAEQQQQQQPQLPAGHPEVPGMAGAMPGMMLPGPAADPQLAAQISYQTPPTWIKDQPMPMRVVSFHIGENDKRADLIVSLLPSTSGSRLDNINRWRGQIGLPSIKESDPQPSQPVTVGGAEGALFDLVGPGDRTRARHMLVAWVPKGNDWWFFKFAGPDDVVTKELDNFMNFLKSVQFAGGK
jgi:hypothetical protein